MKTIDFDVAQALVNYVERPCRSGTWGETDATQVRTMLCELRESSGTNLPTQPIHAYLDKHDTGKFGRGSDAHLDYFKLLVKKASQ